MILFAESFTAPPGFQPWLMNLAFGAWLALLLWKFWDRITGNTQKRDVKLVNEYLTSKDIATIVRDIAKHDSDLLEFKKAVEKMREDSDNSRRRLYRRTDRMNALLQRIAGKLDVHCEDHTAEDDE